MPRMPCRNRTELVLFRTRGHLRTAKAGRRMVNFIATMKERHSKKPEELYDMIEHCSPGRVAHITEGAPFNRVRCD